MQDQRMNKREVGSGKERIAAEYLKDHGYRILEMNYYCKAGEIDIIAANDMYIAFVEVRTRDASAWESGAQTVRQRKRSLVIRAAGTYLARYPTELQPRFDIAQVTVKDGKPVKFDYIDNAFGAESALI